jgi:SAM-dependent methyltransferase
MDTQAAFWNATAATAVFTHPLDTELLARHVGRSARVLDLGCGYGRVLAELVESGFENVAGADTSVAMVERARRLVPGIAIAQIQGVPTHYETGAFDAVLLFAVLTCIPRDHDQRELMNEVMRLLAPGGVVYLSDFLLQADARNLERYRSGHEHFGRYGVFEAEGGAVFRHHDAAWLRELTGAFAPLVMESFAATTMRGNPARGFRFLGRKLPDTRGR